MLTFWSRKILIYTIINRYYDSFADGPGFMEMASAMAWVENFLNLTNGYHKVTSNEGDQFEYLVPFPLGYTSTMKAHWTTDVIVLDPSCSWQTAMTTRFVNDSDWYVTLYESKFRCNDSNYGLGMFLLSPFL